MIEEIWLTDANEMPYKLARKLRKPEPRQSDTLIHWEEPKVRTEQEMQQQVPNEIRLQTVQHSIPVQVPQRQEQELSPFQKRMLRGDDYRSFSPKSITFPVVPQRNEISNQ